MADKRLIAEKQAIKAKFLQHLADTCHVGQSCEHVGLTRQTLYVWREEDPQFYADWKKALAHGAEVLEDEAIRRGHHGYDVQVYHGGKVAGVERKFSDTLLIFMLKGAMPDKYSDRLKQDITGKMQISDMADEDLNQRIARLAVTTTPKD